MYQAYVNTKILNLLGHYHGDLHIMRLKSALTYTHTCQHEIENYILQIEVYNSKILYQIVNRIARCNKRFICAEAKLYDYWLCVLIPYRVRRIFYARQKWELNLVVFWVNCIYFPGSLYFPGKLYLYAFEYRILCLYRKLFLKLDQIVY